MVMFGLVLEFRMWGIEYLIRMRSRNSFSDEEWEGDG